MDKTEVPQFIYTDIHFAESIEAEASIKALENSRLWLIGSNKRLILLAVDKKNKILEVWNYNAGQKEQLTLQRISRVVADDCRLAGGVWLESVDTEKTPEFILQGRNISSYDNYFQLLDGFKKIFS